MSGTYTRRWASIPAVKRANKALGHSWFSPGAMSFFQSKVETSVLAERYFVTSEHREGPGDRRYTVRIVDDEGAVDTVGDFQQHATLAEAKAALYLTAYPGKPKPACCVGTPSGSIDDDGSEALMCDDDCACDSCVEQREPFPSYLA